MADEPDDNVKIYPPDMSMRNKLGNADLDQVLSPQVVQAAQKTIEKSSEQFWAESLAGMDRLEKLFAALHRESGQTPQAFAKMTEATFAVKVSSGLGGYDLVSALAASLLGHCERLEKEKLVGKSHAIMEWHILSMRRLLKDRVKGDGGEMGSVILAELARLPS